jgi:hypothetical protein
MPSEETLTAETLIWSVAVAVITAALLFVLGAGMIVTVVESNPFFGAKPRWAVRLRHVLDVLLYVGLAVFCLLVFVRFWPL